MRAARAARGTQEVTPVFFGKRVVGTVYGELDGRVHVSPRDLRNLMGFPGGYAEIVAAMRAGKQATGVFYLNGNNGFPQDRWGDLWPIQAGTAALGYTGTAKTARQFDSTTVGAFYHGGDVSPATKYAVSMSLGMSVTSGWMLWLYDRVLSYDECTITNATQTMTNTLTAQRWVGTGLPGLRFAPTMSLTDLGATVGAWNTVTYTNEASVGTRTSPFGVTWSYPVNQNAPSGATGVVSACTCYDATNFFDLGPFLPLQTSDIGMASMTDFKFTANNTGTICYAGIRPLAMIVGPPLGSTKIVNFARDQLLLPRIYDGACLGFLVYSADNTGVNGAWTGHLDFAWN